MSGVYIRLGQWEAGGSDRAAARPAAPAATALLTALAELEVERRGGVSLTPAQIREARLLVLGAQLEELEALGVRLVEALTRRQIPGDS